MIKDRDNLTYAELTENIVKSIHHILLKHELKTHRKINNHNPYLTEKKDAELSEKLLKSFQPTFTVEIVSSLNMNTVEFKIQNLNNVHTSLSLKGLFLNLLLAFLEIEDNLFKWSKQDKIFTYSDVVQKVIKLLKNNTKRFSIVEKRIKYKKGSNSITNTRMIMRFEYMFSNTTELISFLKSQFQHTYIDSIEDLL